MSSNNNNHVEDGASLFEDWQKVRDDSGNVYWWNVKTDETRWKLPPGAVQTMKLSPAPATAKTPQLPPKRSIEPAITTANAATGNSKKPPTKPEKPKRSIFNPLRSSGEGKPGRSGSAEKIELMNKLKQMRKEKGSDVGMQDVVDSLEIGTPYQVEHKVKVRFDADHVRFSGLPSEWSDEAHKQFGVSLINCLRVDAPGYKSRLPAVLVMLKRRLEELDGYQAEGLFRIAPDGTESKQVKFGINAGHGAESLGKCHDPHVMANLIKQFFRELQPNLLNCLDRDNIMKMAELEKNACAGAVENLPEPHRSLFLWLLDLMAGVARCESVNRMSAKNLAIVMAPNLFDSGENASPMEAVVLSQKCATLVTNFLNWRMTAK